MKQVVDFDNSCSLLHLLGDMLHALQRERGVASLYLDSKGELFSKELEENFKITDAIIKNYSDEIAKQIEKQSLPSFISFRQQNLLSHLLKLNDLRQKIKTNELRYTLVINEYTFGFNLPLIEGMVELAHKTEGHQSQLVSAYSNFLHWKERLGLERALGSRGFYANAFRNSEFCDRMIALLAEQNSHFKTFVTLASPQQMKLIKDLHEDDSMRKIQQINHLLETNAAPAKVESFTAEAWFHLMTEMIDKLRVIERKLVETLSSESQEQALNDSKLNQNIPVNVSAYKGFLSSLKLFSEISEQDIDSLLSESEVRPFSKGKLLILEGEPANRLYVILQGWVKVFNGNESGDEAILQMLTAGDTLLETAILLNSISPISAQTVEDAVVLSFPAPLIRKFIKNNNVFALSMLNRLSLHSQGLVRKLESSRLKTATERVGWFLLSSYLEQDQKVGFVELPYDKASIASFLDMRPETFSRALKSLRSEGFEIQDNRIKLPGDHSLCQFCDAHLATGCNRKINSECPSFSDVASF